MSRHLAALILLLAPAAAVAAPVEPIVPCGGEVYVFGGSTMMGDGVRAAGSTDFPARMETFFERVCGGEVTFTKSAEESGRFVDDVAAISERLARSPRSVAFVHFPFTDLEAGTSVDRILQAYRTLLAACTASGSTCIVGGQQPVNALSAEVTDRQLELERRALAAFGANYLPLYRYFRSESGVRRLMIPLDSGDGRHTDDYGHDLLYKLYRRRLIELTSSKKRR